MGNVHQDHAWKAQEGKWVERACSFFCLMPQYLTVLGGGKSVHADGNAQPNQEIGNRVGLVENPYGNKSGKAEQDAMNGIHKERADANEERRCEIGRILVDDVPGGIAKAEK